MKKIILALFLFSVSIGIFTPVSLSLKQGSLIVSQTTAYAVSASDDGLYEASGGCGIGFFSGTSLGGCLVGLLYFIPYYIGGQVLSMAAKFMDATAGLTLSSKLFSEPFVATCWGILRDFANMFFIFILLYIAISMILNLSGHYGEKKMIVSVIVIALVINFSMFIADAVIDFSNVTALIFYNQLGATDSNNDPVTVKPTEYLTQNLGNKEKSLNSDVVPPKPIGLSLATHFHPQIFSQPTFWQNIATEKKDRNGPIMLIELVMGFLYFAVAYSFFVVGISFIGRMIELWILIIASPIAFISYILPDSIQGGMKDYGWKKWWSSLFKISFAAPVYFFFLLIIGIMMQAIFSKPPPASGSDWMTVLLGSVILPALVIYTLIMKATEYAKDASGAIGQKLGGLAEGAAKAVGGGALALAGGGAAMAGKAALSATGGAVSGATAFLGKNTLGRGAAALEKTQFKDWGKGVQRKLQDAGSKSGVMGRVSRGALGVVNKAVDAKDNVLKNAQTASYDIRHTASVQQFSAQTGMSFGSVGALAAKNTIGGYANRDAIQENRAKDKREKQAKVLGYDKKKKEAIDTNIKTRKEDIKKEQDKIKDEHGHGLDEKITNKRQDIHDEKERVKQQSDDANNDYTKAERNEKKKLDAKLASGQTLTAPEQTKHTTYTNKEQNIKNINQDVTRLENDLKQLLTEKIQVKANIKVLENGTGSAADKGHGTSMKGSSLKELEEASVNTKYKNVRSLGHDRLIKATVNAQKGAVAGGYTVDRVRVTKTDDYGNTLAVSSDKDLDKKQVYGKGLTRVKTVIQQGANKVFRTELKNVQKISVNNEKVSKERHAIDPTAFNIKVEKDAHGKEVKTYTGKVADVSAKTTRQAFFDQPISIVQNTGKKLSSTTAKGIKSMFAKTAAADNHTKAHAPADNHGKKNDHGHAPDPHHH